MSGTLPARSVSAKRSADREVQRGGEQRPARAARRPRPARRRPRLPAPTASKPDGGPARRADAPARCLRSSPDTASAGPVLLDMRGEAAEGGEDLVVPLVIRAQLHAIGLGDGQRELQRVDRIKPQPVAEQGRSGVDLLGPVSSESAVTISPASSRSSEGAACGVSVVESATDMFFPPLHPTRGSSRRRGSRETLEQAMDSRRYREAASKAYRRFIAPGPAVSRWVRLSKQPSPPSCTASPRCRRRSSR